VNGRSLRILAGALALAASASLGAARAETVAITGGKVVTLGAAGTIDGGTVLIENGQIRAVGRDVAIPAGARRIDAAGKIVTPGLMDSLSRLGLTEVSAEDDTNDISTEDDRITAAYDVADAINPRSVLIPINRIDGLTRAVVAPGPEHFMIGGQGAVIDLGGDASFLVKPQVAMFAVLNERFGGGSRAAALLRIREAFEDALDYAKNRKLYEQAQRRSYSLSRLDLVALQPVLRGEMPLVVSANRASDITAVLRLAKDYKLKLVLAGAAEGWVVAKEIAAAKVPVLVNPIHNLPSSFDALGATLENPARLQAAGVTVAFLSGGAHEAASIRFEAGNAVAYGMPWDAALAGVTSVPARIWGIADHYGTLEAGKDADVVVWDGDPLEVTSFPTAVFIRGRQMPMRSRQLDLRDRYKDLSGDMPWAYRQP
jgi:imidazolonepropionase-like amidohydrolase